MFRRVLRCLDHSLDEVLIKSQAITLIGISALYLSIKFIEGEAKLWKSERILCYTANGSCEGITSGFYSLSPDYPVCYFVTSGDERHVCSGDMDAMSCMFDADIKQGEINDLYQDVGSKSYFENSTSILVTSLLAFAMTFTRDGNSEPHDEDEHDNSVFSCFGRTIITLFLNTTLIILMFVSAVTFALVQSMSCPSGASASEAAMCESISECNAVVMSSIDASVPILKYYPSLVWILLGFLCMSYFASNYGRHRKAHRTLAILPLGAGEDWESGAGEGPQESVQTMMNEIDQQIWENNRNKRSRRRRNGATVENNAVNGEQADPNAVTQAPGGIPGGANNNDSNARPSSSFAVWDAFTAPWSSRGGENNTNYTASSSSGAGSRLGFLSSNRIADAAARVLGSAPDDDADDDESDEEILSEGGQATAYPPMPDLDSDSEDGEAEMRNYAAVQQSLVNHVRHTMARRQRLVKRWVYKEVAKIPRNSVLYKRIQEQSDCAICLCPLIAASAAAATEDRKQNKYSPNSRDALLLANETKTDTNDSAAATEAIDLVLVEVPCAHWFHRNCLLRWIATNMNNAGHSAVQQSCPVCRADLSNGQQPAADS